MRETAKRGSAVGTARFVVARQVSDQLHRSLVDVGWARWWDCEDAFISMCASYAYTVDIEITRHLPGKKWTRYLNVLTVFWQLTVHPRLMQYLLQLPLGHVLRSSAPAEGTEDVDDCWTRALLPCDVSPVDLRAKTPSYNRQRQFHVV